MTMSMTTLGLCGEVLAIPAVICREPSAALCRWSLDNRFFCKQATCLTLRAMDFLRDRGFAYAIGAIEFADNIRLNILDKLLPYGSPHHVIENAESLEGKV